MSLVIDLHLDPEQVTSRSEEKTSVADRTVFKAKLVCPHYGHSALKVEDPFGEVAATPISPASAVRGIADYFFWNYFCYIARLGVDSFDLIASSDYSYRRSLYCSRLWSSC